MSILLIYNVIFITIEMIIRDEQRGQKNSKECVHCTVFRLKSLITAEKLHLWHIITDFDG